MFVEVSDKHRMEYFSLNLSLCLYEKKDLMTGLIKIVMKKKVFLGNLLLDTEQTNSIIKLYMNRGKIKQMIRYLSIF